MVQLNLPDDSDEAWEEKALSRENAAKRLGKVRQAMEMKIQGYTYDQIAADLGYGSAEAAAADVREELERDFLANENIGAEVLRSIEIKRLNMLYNALLIGIERGNTRSIDIAVKVSERIAKLTGIEAAQKVEVVEMNAVNAEIERLQREIAERQQVRALPAPPVMDAEIVD